MPEHKDQSNALVAVVREATARFRDVSVAQGEGHALQFGCVSGSDAGAMGLTAFAAVSASHDAHVLIMLGRRGKATGRDER